MNSFSLTLLFLTVAAAVLAGTRLLIPVLRQRAVFDHPNKRSSHQTPTPKGGGLIVIAVILAAWIGVAWFVDTSFFLMFLIPGVALVLALISWVDDLYGLPPTIRLLVHITAVSTVLVLRSEPTLFFQGLLPPHLDTIAAGLFWVWFINLFNFMDGIDGITGVETLVIGLGIALIGDGLTLIFSLIIAAAALGFLKWNWHPAKIFLGDVGSVPLGFLLGWLLLDLAGNGHWAAALILPAYYLLDATITLIRRAIRGEKVWQAHSQHIYQQALKSGLSHAAVSTAIFAVGVVLVGLAWSAEHGWTLPALFTAGLLNVVFLWFLANGKKP
jgi:UDP-N-acetylmuramyl pentapeptide phosphotransferase/UDP-N-acetylglucosamine-1-phosphate transferase